MQLQIPLFTPEMFNEIARVYTLQEYVELQKKAEHMKHQIAGFKGYRTKRKKGKC